MLERIVDSNKADAAGNQGHLVCIKAPSITYQFQACYNLKKLRPDWFLTLQDATDVWNTDSEQTSALFDSMVKKMETNCLCENRLSAIQCPEAKRDPELAKKVPVPPLQEKPAPQHSNKYAKKIDSILAGTSSILQE